MFLKSTSMSEEEMEFMARTLTLNNPLSQQTKIRSTIIDFNIWWQCCSSQFAPSSGLENTNVCMLPLNMSLFSDKASPLALRLKSSFTGAPRSKDTPMTRSFTSGQSPSSAHSTQACRPSTGSSRQSSKPEDTGWTLTLLEALKVKLWQPGPSCSITLTLSVRLWGVCPLSAEELTTKWLPW